MSLPRRGFALIELIVMILLLLVLSSSVAVYYRQMMDENRVQIVHNDLAFLRRQVVVHRMKHPGKLTSLSQLEQLKDDSLIDPWGHDYRLLEGEPPRILSTGPDGEIDAEEETAGDDIQITLTAAVMQEVLPPPPVEPGQAMVDHSTQGFEIVWLNPGRPAAGSPRVERLAPCAGGTGSPSGFDRSLCDSLGQGPALHFALVLRRRADTRPNAAADRLVMETESRDTAIRLELTTPRGTETLTAAPVDRLPCCLAERLHAEIQRRPPAERILAPGDWYFLQEGAVPDTWERVYYRFYRATVEQEPCTGTYHTRVTVEQASTRAELASSTLSWVMLEPAHLHVDSTVPVANVHASPRPPAIEITFSGEDARVVANMINGQRGDRMQVSLEALLDGQPLMRNGAAVILDEQRFRLKLDWPPSHPPGSHRIELRLFYSTLDSPGGQTLCREWSYSS